jgi:catechol 2,3-dioxygenase
MGGIMRLGFVELQVTDLGQAAAFYQQVLGLEVTHRTDNALYCKCWDEYDHHSVILRQARSLGLVKIGWKVEGGHDLEDLETKIQASGAPVKRVSRGEEFGIGDGIAFTAPSGQMMLLYHEMTQVGRMVAPPEIVPPDRMCIAPPRLDHLVISAENVDEAVQFMTNVLGFHVSEQVLDPTGHAVVSFLFKTNTPHDIAISHGPSGKFHHVAFALDDWNDVKRAADLLTRHQQRVEVPPSQHGITRGYTTYFLDPLGNRLETFAGGYLTYPDFPTITWTVGQLDRGFFYSGGPTDMQAFMQWI